MPTPKVMARGRILVLRFDMVKENFNLVRDLPDQLGYEGRNLRFEPTPRAVEFVDKIFPNAIWDEASKGIRVVMSKQSVARAAVSAISAFAFKTIPFTHQLEVFEISKDRKFYALLMEQGTGKTKVAIDNAAYLYSRGEILGMAVIAPNGVHRNWATDEIPVHMPDFTNYQSVTWTAAKGERLLTKMLRDQTPGLKVFCINVEALSTMRGENALKDFLLAFPTMCVVDEATTIKSPKSKRSKAMIRLGRFSPYRRVLTGTIVTKGPLDVYTPMEFLSDKITGFTSFYSFRARYAIMKNVPGDKKDRRGQEIKVPVAWQNLEELRDKIKEHSYRKLKSECFDLPPKLYKRRPFQMSDEQWDHYSRMENEFETTTSDGRIISAPMAMVRQMRLAQIACGYLPTDNPEVNPGAPIGKTLPRLEALLEDLEELIQSDSKILIYAPWRAALRDIYEGIRKNFGSECVVAYGGQMSKQSDDDKALSKKRFQQDGKVRILVGQSDAIARGHTLTQAAFVQYYCQRYDLEVRMQSEDRPHRWGQLNPVLYSDYEAQYNDNFTTDRDVIECLKKKKVIADLINGDNPPTEEWIAEQQEAIDFAFYARYGYLGDR